MVSGKPLYFFKITVVSLHFHCLSAVCICSVALSAPCRTLVVIGLTELPNSGWAKAHPAHPLAASLHDDADPLK